MANIKRIQNDIVKMKSDLDHSIDFSYTENDLRRMTVFILGPGGTPYEFGFFEFKLRFPSDYPLRPPKVRAITTDKGRCRFNPNIYSNGKVCLSTLGTWEDPKGLQWSSILGLDTLLRTIQTLLCDNPYKNEPGFEHEEEEEDGQAVAYAKKIKHETIRITVVQRLEEYLGLTPALKPSPASPVIFNGRDEKQYCIDDDDVVEPFQDLCKRRFLWYYDSYIKAVCEGAKEFEDETKFSMMPFEDPSNAMAGCYRYGLLRPRLEAIKAKLDAETSSWEEEGRKLTEANSDVANDLRRQYDRAVIFIKNNVAGMEANIELVENNPFLWRVTLFGQTLTNLDNGFFNVKIHVSPEFPQVQPRVKFEAPLFHYRMASDGTFAYFPRRPEDLRSHIEAVIKALADENPSHDFQTFIHPEASELLWGREQDKKKYNRKLRRSVEDSQG